MADKNKKIEISIDVNKEMKIEILKKPSTPPEDDFEPSLTEQVTKELSLKKLTKKFKGEMTRKKPVFKKEDKFWKKVIKSNKKEDYEEYLEKYPEGAYSVQAQSEIYYHFIVLGDLTIGECTTYLDRYPTERHAEEIRERLDRFRAEDQKRKVTRVTIAGIIFFGIYMYHFITAPPQPKQSPVAKKLIEVDLKKPALESVLIPDDLNDAEVDTKLIVFEPDYLTTYFNRGLEYIANGEYDLAILEFNKVIKLNPDHILSYFNRGYAYNETGRFEMAILDYNRAIELDPGDPSAYHNRGIAFEKAGRHDMAIQDYSKAIDLYPDDPSAYHSRGEAYYEKGDYDSAIQDFSKTIELDPDHSSAYHNRGYSYNEKGEYDSAIQDFSKTIELDPDYSPAYHNRGYSYLEKGEYDMAVSDYSKVLELQPDDPLAYYSRGMTYSLKGNKELAKSDLQKAKDLGHAEAEKELDMMR